MPNPTPKLFDGYRITREAFVRGGSGVVHEAVDPRGRRVAIKVLDRAALEQKLFASVSEETHDPNLISRKTSLAYEKNVERFKEEYRNLTGLNHPNIAKVYEMGFREGSFFIVYEYVDGKPIAEYLSLRKPADMIPLFIEALKGLDYIHRNGLLHLDIKSENILVQVVDGEPKVKIIDFGLSMTPGEYKGWFLGSVNYMAPEIVLGLKDQLDARADLFSFGVLMYYCITWGSHPYARPPKADRELMCRVIKREPSLEYDPPSRTHQSRPGYVPEFLDKIVMRLVAHDPKDRFYGNARAVINALAMHAPDAFAESLGSKGSYLRPIGDRHIGNEVEQTKVYAAIDALALGETPSPAVVEITGEQGAGKSHLLKKIKEHAERYADKLVIKKIELPADETTLKRFSDDITLWASENKIPAVVLVDDCHSCEGRNPVFQNILNTATSRQSNPTLYSGQQPLFIAFTSLSFLRKQESSGATLAIHLSPFTQNDLKQYLSSTPAFAGKKVPDEFVSRLHVATNGIQAEVDAHLRERDSDGMLFNLDGEIVVGDFKRHERPPATTEARLQKTYDGLLPEERRILDFLSVWSLKQIASPPDFETISHLIPLRLLTLQLNNLIQASILSFPHSATVIPADLSGDPMKSITGSPIKALGDDKPGYSFTNSYFSSFIYEQMDEKEKTHWHDSIAKYLLPLTLPSPSPARQRCSGGRGEGKGEGDLKNAILLHQGFGSNKPLAIKSLVRLAKTTLYDKGRADLAGWLIARASLPIGEKQDKLKIYLKNLQASAKFFEGKFDEVLQITRHEIAGGTDALGVSLQIWGVFSLIKQGRHGEAEKKTEELFVIRGSKKGDIFYPTLLNLKAFNLYSQSFAEPDRAVSLLKEAREVYCLSKLLEEKLPARNAARINTNNLGAVLMAMGEPSHAAVEFEESLSRREHTVFSRAVSLIALAEARRLLGENEKAMIHAEEALRLALMSGLGEWLVYAHWVFANIYHDTDRFDEAIEEDRKYLAASGCIEDKDRHRETSVRLWVHMGHCYKEKGDYDSAILHFDAAIESGAKGFNLMSAHLGTGESHYHKGNSETAGKHLSEAKTLLASLPAEASAKSHLARIERLEREMR